jgi:hypothetical protein
VDDSRRRLPVLPVACTLGVADGAAQVERWRRLNARALIHQERRDDELLLVYRADDDTRAELEGLVAVETTCCAFLDWQVEAGAEDLRLRISGTAADLDTLDLS